MLSPRSRLCLPLSLAVTLGASAPALASPIDEGHVGGVGFAGPTEPSLAALYWNPGALGLLQGNQLMLAGSGRYASTTIERTAIDPVTGQPGGTRAFPAAHSHTFTQPVSWPPGPGGFAALGTDLGSRFVLAVGAYSPFGQRVDYRGNAETATRYHAVRMDLRNLALVPAVAFRIGQSLSVGFAPGFLFSTGRVTFDEETGLAPDTLCDGAPCGAENPAAAARYDASSGRTAFGSRLAFTLGAGLLVQRPTWSFGLSFLSRPLGNGDGAVEIDERYTTVTRPPRAGGGSVCSPLPAGTAALPDPCVTGHLRYRLPDTLIAGASFRLSPRWEATFIGRWLDLSVHDTLLLRLQGPAGSGLRDAGLAERVSLARGFRDVLDLRARALFSPRDWVRLAATLRFETGAVGADRLSPASVGGALWEPAVAVQLRLGGRLSLSAGYALAFQPTTSTGTSAFDPGAAGACTASGGDLDNPACYRQRAGYARPTAAGRYGQTTQTFSLTGVASF